MLLATILATAFVALTAAAPCPELRELRILWQIPAGGTAQWQVYRGYPDKNMPNGALVYPGIKYYAEIWGVTAFPGPIISERNTCLDAGLSPKNGTPLKIWDCIDGAPQQTWENFSGGKFKLAGTNLCVDVTNGNTTLPLQLWECYPNNPNQVFTFFNQITGETTASPLGG